MVDRSPVRRVGTIGVPTLHKHGNAFGVRGNTCPEENRGALPATAACVTIGGAPNGMSAKAAVFTLMQSHVLDFSPVCVQTSPFVGLALPRENKFEARAHAMARLTEFLSCFENRARCGAGLVAISMSAGVALVMVMVPPRPTLAP